MIIVPSNITAVRAYSLDNKERYNIVLVKRSAFRLYNKSLVTCYHVMSFCVWLYSPLCILVELTNHKDPPLGCYRQHINYLTSDIE